MTRRCSQCSNNGHNARTCPGKTGGVRLFGVRLTEGVRTMKKSASMGCLSSAVTAAAVAPGSPDPPQEPADAHASGYASDDPRASSSSNSRAERKKGIPWTEEEHQMFLLGLQKLGKGDWRGISRNFVISRTPTQVASHAQKYFIRQSNASRKKRRSSLFDMVPQPKNHLPLLKEQQMPQCPPSELECTNQLPSFKLCQDQGSEPAESSSRNSPEMRNHPSYACGPAYNTNSMPVVSAFYPALFPVQFAYWPAAVITPVEEAVAETHEVLKPTPVLPKDPANAAAIAGMSKLSIVEGSAIMDPASLSLKLMEDSSLGQSAFHMNPTIASSGLSQSSSNAIHAV